MNPLREESIRQATVLNVAKKMMIAARTAPKARGIDHIEIIFLQPKEILEVSHKMKAMYATGDYPEFFARDAENILSADAMIALGTEIAPLDLPNCGMCGFENCQEKLKHPQTPCIFNTGDLGIAIGSAASVAMDHRVDNRIMYTVGTALKEMKVFQKEIHIAYAIPLSVSSKNPFFDRKK